MPVPGDVICGVTLPGTEVTVRVTGFVSPAARCTVTLSVGDELESGRVVELDDRDIETGSNIGAFPLLLPPQPSRAAKDPSVIESATFRPMLNPSSAAHSQRGAHSNADDCNAATSAAGIINSVTNTFVISDDAL